MTTALRFCLLFFSFLFFSFLFISFHFILFHLNRTTTFINQFHYQMFQKQIIRENTANGNVGSQWIKHGGFNPIDQLPQNRQVKGDRLTTVNETNQHGKTSERIRIHNFHAAANPEVVKRRKVKGERRNPNQKSRSVRIELGELLSIFNFRFRRERLSLSLSLSANISCYKRFFCFTATNKKEKQQRSNSLNWPNWSTSSQVVSKREKKKRKKNRTATDFCCSNRTSWPHRCVGSLSSVFDCFHRLSTTAVLHRAHRCVQSTAKCSQHRPQFPSVERVGNQLLNNFIDTRLQR